MNANARFWNSALLVVLAFTAVNVAMARWSHRLPLRKKVLEVRSAPNANVVLIGNSLLDGRVDESTFRQAAEGQGHTLIPLNAALGASSPSDQYLLFRLAMRNVRPRAIVVGFFDFQLTQGEQNQVSDLIGSRALGFDPDIQADEARAIYHFGLLDRLKYTVFRALPALAYRSNAWEYVEKLRRKFAAIGMPHDGGNNEFGRIADFNALESSSVGQFDKEAQNFIAHPDQLNQPNELILEQAHANGIPVLFLVMPISPYHRATFYREPQWTAYLQALRTLLEQRGAVLVDGSAWFPDENDFADRLHLKFTQTRSLAVKIEGAVSGNLPLDAH